MLKKCIFPVLLIIFILFGSSVALADESDPDADYPWQYHAPPFDFSFGNMINSHQQSRMDSNGVLHGFIYIHDTGEITEEGFPIAEKAHCPTQDCRVGWVVKGVQVTATLMSKGPRIWLVDPNDLPVEPGYTHFHWIGDPHSPHDLVIGQQYTGILMKRMAVTPFYWLGGSGQGGGGHGGSGGGGCGGDEGGCGGDEGGCSGDEGGCSGDEGGCSGDEGGCSGDEGGCSGGGGDMGGGDMGGGGCSGDEGGCSGDEGGCGGDEGGCGGEEGGCGGSSGHGGRLVMEGLDPHRNIITDPDEPWHGGGCDD